MDYDTYGLRDSDLVIQKLRRQMDSDKDAARSWYSRSAICVCSSLLVVIALELNDVSMVIVSSFAGVTILAFLVLHFIHRKNLEEPKSQSIIEPYPGLLMRGDHRGEDGAAVIETTLTRREIQILQLIAEGNINKQIARELGLSPATVRNHVSRVMQKLDVNDRTAAAVMALSNGWINVEVRRTTKEPRYPFQSQNLS